MDEELLRIIDLFDNDEVTTADKIDPPENPYRDFMDRNPQAEGGRTGYKLAGAVKDGKELPKNIRLTAPGGKFRFDTQAGGKNFTKIFSKDTDLEDVIKFRNKKLKEFGIEEGKFKKSANPERGKYAGVKGQKHIKFNGVTYQVSVQRMKDGKMITEKPFYTSDLDEAIKVRDKRVLKSPPKVEKGVVKPDRKKIQEKIDKRRFIQKTKEGRTNIAYKPPKGYQVHHLLPLSIASPDTKTKDLAVINAQMNKEIAQFDKPIKDLTEEAFTLDFNGDRKNALKRLNEINKELNDIVKKGVKKLGPEYKGLIGFNEILPVFDSNGVAVDINFKPVGVDFTKSIAKNINVPEKVKNVSTPELKKLVSEAPKTGMKLNAKIPGVTELFEMAKSIPDDIKRAKYLKAGFKTLGIAATPLVIYDTYNAYKEGKPILETLEQGIIGTDIIGGTKRFLALTPEEKKARSVVKQDALKDLNVDMPMGFGFIEGPDPMSDLTLEEAQAQATAGDERVKALEAQKNFERATKRSNFFSNIKDKALGIGPDYQLELAGGGIAGLSGGIDEGPQRTSMNPDSQGLRSLKNRVRNL